jgi:hypothetical protein
MLSKNLIRLIVITGFFGLLLNAACKSKAPATPEIAKVESIPKIDDKLWLAMMDSTGVNYFKAVASFEAYWADKEKPTEEDGEGQDLFKEEKDKDKDAPAKPIDYVYEYKRFLNWQQRNKNLVKPDGTLMTPEEQLEQWKKTKTDTLAR